MTRARDGKSRLQNTRFRRCNDIPISNRTERDPNSPVCDSGLKSPLKTVWYRRHKLTSMPSLDVASVLTLFQSPSANEMSGNTRRENRSRTFHGFTTRVKLVEFVSDPEVPVTVIV